MARVTIEDCQENLENRFTMVLAARKRARQLTLGATPTLPWDNDKPTVMALREIAAGHLDETGELLDAYKETSKVEEDGEDGDDENDNNEIEIEIGRMSDEGDIAPMTEQEQVEKEESEEDDTEEA